MSTLCEAHLWPASGEARNLDTGVTNFRTQASSFPLGTEKSVAFTLRHRGRLHEGKFCAVEYHAFAAGRNLALTLTKLELERWEPRP